MKRTFTFYTMIVCFCALSSSSFAQIIFFQGFENGIEPMKLYNEDGRTPADNVSAYVDAWNVANPAFGNGTNVAVSTSWYTPAGASDDWMVTPALNISGPDVVVAWTAKAQDASYRDGYQVLISTATDAVADFTTVLFETTAEETVFTNRQVSLSAYEGQDVYIAWRNNSNDQFLLVVDNILVGTPKQNDATLVNANARINRGTALEGSRNVEGSIYNSGLDEITSIQMTYLLNNEEPQTATIENISILTGETKSVTHPVMVDFVEGLEQNLYVSVNQVNGVEDVDLNTTQIENFKVFPPVPNFDLVSTKGETYKLHDVMTSGKAVVLDFFASWCGPCVASTPELNTFYVDNGAGDEQLEVFGISIEPTDTDVVVDGLGWGATYPKFSYSETAEDFWTHFNTNHGLGANSIPFFVSICPNLEDPGHSEISTSAIGFVGGMFSADFQPVHDDCVASLTTSVKNIASLTEAKVFPNPANDRVQLEFELLQTADINVQVTNMLGQVISDLGTQSFIEGNNRLEVETYNYANGMYALTLKKGKEISTFRFSVAH